MASTYYGEPRFTHDVDIVADVERSHVQGLLDAFPVPEFYISDIAVREAVARQEQFNVLHPDSGLKADIIVKSREMSEMTRFGRVRSIQFPQGDSVPVSSPEDLILAKLDFYRIGESQKHLRDIIGVLKTQGNAIDRAYLVQRADQLDLLKLWREVERIELA